MDRRDASSGEMPGFFLPSRPGSELGEPLLDALLDRRSLPPDAPEEACVVAEMLADLTGPAEPGELAGEAVAWRGLARTPSPAGISPAARLRTRRRWPVCGARPAAALIAVAVALGGTTAAAYSGALPRPIQDFAHHAIGAPPARGARPPGRQPAPAGPRPDAHGKTRQAIPGLAKGHAKPLPAQAHGKAKGHARQGTPGPARRPKERPRTLPGAPSRPQSSLPVQSS